MSPDWGDVLQIILKQVVGGSRKRPGYVSEWTCCTNVGRLQFNLLVVMLTEMNSTLEEKHVAEYLSRLTQRPIRIEQIVELGGGSEGAAALKGFGYGRPLRITYLDDGQRKAVVLRRVNRNGFGREYASDRAGEVWRDFHTFNQLPRHIQVEDMVMIDEDGRLHSIAQAQELLLLTNYEGFPV